MRLLKSAARPILVDEEPACEVWERMLNGETIAEISEHFGYGLKYGCRLAAQAACREILSGVTYETCANLFGEHESFCWQEIEKSLTSEDLAKTGNARRIWRLVRIGTLHLEGNSPTDIAAILGQSESEITRDLRPAQIVASRLRGDTLESIGAKVDLTRERVRQILKDLDIDKMYLEKYEAAAKSPDKELREAVERWVHAHPGCTPAEIAQSFEIRETEANELIPKSCLHLVLDSRFRQNERNLQVRAASKTRIIAAIRQAATIRDGDTGLQSEEAMFLTGPRYTSLQRSGLVDGPTLARILQVFGTWRSACASAEVNCDEPLRDEYDRRWTRLQMSQSVADFLVSEGRNGVSKYDEWARINVGRPSFGTIRNEFGSWRAAYEEALRLLRSSWLMKSGNVSNWF
jgi:hypothetical protein